MFLKMHFPRGRLHITGLEEQEEEEEEEW